MLERPISKAGWTRMRFDQIATQINDRVDNPAEAGVERYVGLEHLDPDSLRIRRWGEPTDVESTKLRFQPGDIIFGKRRVYQRKVAVADFEGICSAHAMVLRGKTGAVLPEFLPFFMQSDLFMERALSISVGSLSPTINWKVLAAEEFLLPPIQEQARLVEYFQSFESVTQSLQNLKRASEQAFRSACITFGHELLLDVTLPRLRLEEAGELILGRQRSPDYQSGQHTKPYLRVANVFDGFITTDDVLEMDFDERDFAKYVLKNGDILLNEGQSRELVGRSAIFRDEVRDCCFQNTLIRFRSEMLLPEFAHSFFRFMLYSGKFVEISSQTSSIAHVGLSRLKSVEIVVPNMADQRNWIRHISALDEKSLAVSARRRQLDSLMKRWASEEFGGVSA